MNTLQFDFLVDKEMYTITVKREFAANRQLIWDCYTKSEMLDQWFAPEPFATKTKSMDFSEGGHWHYAMIDPDGKEYWGWTEYTKIKAIDYYKTLDAFSDSEGNLNSDLPQAEWHIEFSDKGKNTLVVTTVQYDSLEALDQVINMGMKDGLTSTLERLDKLLSSLK
ncbi:MAG: SRPBCC domain-containing protein [Cyclobacteriaceae bacterium]